MATATRTRKEDELREQKPAHETVLVDTLWKLIKHLRKELTSHLRQARQEAEFGSFKSDEDKNLHMESYIETYKESYIDGMVVLPEDFQGELISPYLNGEEVDLFKLKCLYSHLRHSFPNIKIPHFKYGDLTDKFINSLCMIASTRDFKGTCVVCADWYADLSTLPTISELEKEFLEFKKGSDGVKESTLETYHGAINNLNNTFNNKLPTEPESLKKFLNNPKRQKSGYITYGSLNPFYNYIEEHYRVPNPLKDVKRPKREPSDKFYFKPEQVKAIVDVCQNKKELALIHLYLGHGIRRSEAVMLNISCIEEDQIFINDGKERNEYNPLLPETRDLLREIAGDRKPSSPILLNNYGKRMSDDTAYDIVKDIFKRAGVLKHKREDQRIGTHVLRKTFSTLATHAGCGRSIVFALLRDKPQSVVDKHYVNVEEMPVKLENLLIYSPLRLMKNTPTRGGGGQIMPYQRARIFHQNSDSQLHFRHNTLIWSHKYKRMECNRRKWFR
jgi:integrase